MSSCLALACTANAVRTGAYAGVSEPEFGPDEEFTVGGEFKMKVPLWCKVTVRRRFWMTARSASTQRKNNGANYATAGKDTTAPNAMWKKRPYAQLAKCAEAQALRKAFPAGADRCEEMEGKSVDDTAIEGTARRVNEAPAPPALSMNSWQPQKQRRRRVTPRSLRGGETVMKTTAPR